jgi:hypothetical protein
MLQYPGLFRAIREMGVSDRMTEVSIPCKWAYDMAGAARRVDTIPAVAEFGGKSNSTIPLYSLMILLCRTHDLVMRVLCARAMCDIGKA